MKRVAVGHFHLEWIWLPAFVANDRSLTSVDGEVETGARATKKTAGKSSPVVVSVARKGEGA